MCASPPTVETTWLKEFALQVRDQSDVLEACLNRAPPGSPSTVMAGGYLVVDALRKIAREMGATERDV